jgi:transcription initiation factor IIE alpha subunit
LKTLLGGPQEASVEEIANQTEKNYSTILRAISELSDKKIVSFRLSEHHTEEKNCVYTLSVFMD